MEEGIFSTQDKGFPSVSEELQNSSVSNNIDSTTKDSSVSNNIDSTTKDSTACPSQEKKVHFEFRIFWI